MQEAEFPVSIRDATRDDIPAIARCLHQAFDDYRDSYTPGAFADTVLTHTALQRRMETMCVLVAVRQSGEIVGTIAYQAVDEMEGHIRGMAVDPQVQGSGIAAKLLSSVESKLRNQHCFRITLDTTEPLVRAVRFYEKNGFRRSGYVRDFFGMPLLEYVKVLTE